MLIPAQPRRERDESHKLVMHVLLYSSMAAVGMSVMWATTTRTVVLRAYSGW